MVHFRVNTSMSQGAQPLNRSRRNMSSHSGKTAADLQAVELLLLKCYQPLATVLFRCGIEVAIRVLLKILSNPSSPSYLTDEITPHDYPHNRSAQVISFIAAFQLQGICTFSKGWDASRYAS